jgi:peptidoglycan hydrolase-like protein with peptidoglycan-binding domain/DNA invertase Pin-like site-specific DNA recombinase
MRTTYWVPGARRRGFSLVAGLALLCLAGTMVSSSPARAAEAPTAKSELLTTGDGYGQPRGSTPVRALQRRLRTLGLRPGAVDGLFGPQTKAAVESFQHAAGLQVDGIVGPQTRRTLRRASAPMLGRGAGYNKRGGSVRVRVLQRQLRRLGLRPGPIDGLYGPLTAAAVGRFQRDQGSASDGVAWARTRRAIAAARRAAETRLIREDDATTSRTGGSKPASSPARDEGVRATAVRAHAPSDGTSRSEEASELGLLALSGLLAFMFVAGAFTLGRTLAIAPAGAMPGGATPPADGPSTIPYEAPPPHAAWDPDEDTNWGDDGDRPLEAVGYVTAGDTTRAKLDVRRQISAMDAVCERRGWRLVEVARDVGDLSGTALDRPGLNYALERLKSGERFCLIVSELRRLGGSSAELGRVLTWLRDRGLRLVAVDVELDTAAADGRIAADALISVGERAERGQLTSRGERDPGDRRPGRQAVRDLPELREHILALRSAGMTLQAIADRLNEEGVPTVRGGREWRPSSVQVAAGYRRPRRLSSPRNTRDRSAERRRAEDR